MASQPVLLENGPSKSEFQASHDLMIRIFLGKHGPENLVLSDGIIGFLHGFDPSPFLFADQSAMLIEQKTVCWIHHDTNLQIW